MPIDEARKAALRAKFGDKFENRSQIGGKGTMRRKKRTVRKKDTQDDKRLQGALKRLSVNNIPAIEEVNLFRKGDDTVIHFNQPRVQASIAANTYVVSGNCETKKVMDMIPQILPQLGPDNLENLKHMANQIQKLQNQAAGGVDDDDDEVPDLVENVNFEDVAAEEVVVQDDDADEDDDDIPDLVETATFDDHVPIAVSTEPNPEDNAAPVAVSTEPNPEDNADPVAVSTEPNPEDTAPVAVSTEPNPEDNAVSTEPDSEENAAPVAVSTDPNPEDNVAAARSSEPELEDDAATDDAPTAVTAESDLKEDAEAAITTKQNNAEETAAVNSEDAAVAVSTEPNPEDNAATSSGDEDPIVAVSTEPNPEDSKGAKEDLKE